MMSWNSSLLADLARRRMPAGSTVREMAVATRSREPRDVDTLRTVVAISGELVALQQRAVAASVADAKHKTVTNLRHVVRQQSSASAPRFCSQLRSLRLAWPERLSGALGVTCSKLLITGSVPACTGSHLKRRRVTSNASCSSFGLRAAAALLARTGMKANRRPTRQSCKGDHLA